MVLQTIIILRRWLFFWCFNHSSAIFTWNTNWKCFSNIEPICCSIPSSLANSTKSPLYSKHSKQLILYVYYGKMSNQPQLIFPVKSIPWFKRGVFVHSSSFNCVYFLFLSKYSSVKNTFEIWAVLNGGWILTIRLFFFPFEISLRIEIVCKRNCETKRKTRLWFGNL